MKRKYWIGLALLALYLTLATTTTQLLHFSRTHDEGYHLDLITFIKQTGRLPITYDERIQMARADLPPLYHILVSTFSAPVPITPYPAFKNYYDSLRYRAIDVQTDNPWTLDTEDLQWPYLGRFLVWQIGRWLSVGLSAVTLAVIFLTLEAMPLGQRPLTSLAGAAIIAFTPRFLIVNASLNDDSLLGLTAALYFLLLVWFIKQPQRWWPLLGLGAILGISATVKYSLALIPLELLVVLVLIAHRYCLGWRWSIGRFVATSGVAIIFSGWWFGWNLWHFNTITRDGLVVGTVRALFADGYNATLNQLSRILSGGQLDAAPVKEAAISSAKLSSWAVLTYRTFWGYNVDGRVPLAVIGLATVTALLFLTTIGLWRLWRRIPSSRPWLTLTSGHLLLLIIIPFVRFATSGRIGQTAQGRHILIPAAPAVAALLAWGLAEVMPHRWRRPLFAAIVAAFIGWSSLHMYQLVQNRTPYLPMRTVAQAAEWLPEPVKARFGDGVELVSYKSVAQPAHGQLNIELAWRSLASTNENYLLRVILLDQAGQPVTGWAGYHGAGRLPTIAWDPGDTVFDRLSLPLPNLPEGNYQIQVQLLGPNGQPVTVVQDGFEQSALRLAGIFLPEASHFPFDDTPVQKWPAGVSSVRYPGTLTFVAEQPDTLVELVDPAGTIWPPTAQANRVFNFVVSPRWPSGEYGVRLNGDEVGPAVTVNNWWPRHFSPPEEIETPLQANFANQVYLLGYTLPQKQVRAGEAFPITLYWQAPSDRSPQANFIQFNNLLDSNGALYGGYERLPLEYYSTLLWAPGEVVVDGYAVPVEADAPPGEYYLDVGFYLTVGEAPVNLPLVVDGQRSEGSSVTIGPIQVEQ